MRRANWAYPPLLPLVHGVPRVDDRRVTSVIIDVLKRGLQWRDAPQEYGPYKTFYNRFKRWSEMGLFDRIFTDMSSQGVPEYLQRDASHLNAHRTAASLAKKGMFPVTLGGQKVG